MLRASVFPTIRKYFHVLWEVRCARTPVRICWIMLMFGVPTASPFRHRCTVGVDQDPPVCHEVQGDIMTRRQPAAVLLCCGGGWSAVVCGTREEFR